MNDLSEAWEKFQKIWAKLIKQWSADNPNNTNKELANARMRYLIWLYNTTKKAFKEKYYG